jgi:hypothetical protein
MVKEIRDAFKEGYDTSRFIISTTTVKEKDGKFLCKGRIVQGRGKESLDGEIEWDDRIIKSDALGENHQHINTLVLNSMFQYLVEKEFYLFDGEEHASKDDLQEI